MRKFNEAELFYLSMNRNQDPKGLAKALGTTEATVKATLADLPDARPPEPAAVQPRIAPPALSTMARNKERGTIALTKEATEIGDELSKSGVARKLPDGVGRFHD